MDTIKEIVDPSFRTGEGKKGSWTLMKIVTESGKQATGFSPLEVGDSVVLKYNDQYKNYSAELATGAKIENLKKDELLENIDKKLDRILVLLDGKLTRPTTGASFSNEKTHQPTYPAQPSVELPPIDALDEPLDLSDVPF